MIRLDPGVPSQVIQPNRLKAIACGALALITAIALWALSVVVTFLTGGLIYSQFFPPGGGLAGANIFVINTLFGSLIVGSLASIYPIKHVAGPILAKARALWV